MSAKLQTFTGMRTLMVQLSLNQSQNQKKSQNQKQNLNQNQKQNLNQNQKQNLNQKNL